MKESTRNIIKLHGWRLDRALHNYVYFVFYDRYVSVALKVGHALEGLFRRYNLGRPPFQAIFERYHAKVMTIDDAAKICRLDEDVHVDQERAERVIPFHYANKIILEEPEYIAVMDCPCRLSRENPCQPIDVCLGFGKTIAEFWLEHGSKYNVRRIGQDEALEILRGSHQRGEVITAWLKVATGGRTGIICSCCSCCCGALEAMRVARTFKGCENLSNIAASGYVPVHDPEKCMRCGDCTGACIFGAIESDEDGGPVFDLELCLGCGLCVDRCEKGALTLEADPGKGIPLDIDLLRE